MSQIAHALMEFEPHLLDAYPSTAFALSGYIDRKDARQKSNTENTPWLWR
jgi:hypothetical protein